MITSLPLPGPLREDRLRPEGYRAPESGSLMMPLPNTARFASKKRSPAQSINLLVNLPPKLTVGYLVTEGHAPIGGSDRVRDPNRPLALVPSTCDGPRNPSDIGPPLSRSEAFPADAPRSGTHPIDPRNMPLPPSKKCVLERRPLPLRPGALCRESIGDGTKCNCGDSTHCVLSPLSRNNL